MEMSNDMFNKYMLFRQRENYLNQETEAENKKKKEDGIETGSPFVQQEINKLKAQLETGYDPQALKG